MNKNIKKIVSMVAAIAIIGAMGLGAFSYFTDYATSSKTANAGTMDITLSGVTQDLTNGLTIMNPGDSNNFEFTVTNAAEKSVDVKAVITVTTTDKDGNALNMNADDHQYKITTDDGTELTGVLTNNVIVYTIDDIALIGSVEKEASDGTAASHKYDYQIKMDEQANNTWQDSNVSVKVEVYAKQHRNTESITGNWHTDGNQIGIIEKVGEWEIN